MTFLFVTSGFSEGVFDRFSFSALGKKCGYPEKVHHFCNSTLKMECTYYIDK